MGTRPRAATRTGVRPGQIDDRAVVAEVREVYADLATRPAERTCEARTTCCQFHATGRVPQLTRGEALVVAKAVRSTGRTRLPDRADGACPLLNEAGKCIIYESRPFGCRTHFCAAAGGPYARRDVLDLIRRLEQIDERLGGDGPHPLATAVRLTRLLE